MPVMQQVASAQTAYLSNRIRRTVPTIERTAGRAIAAGQRIEQTRTSIAGLPERFGPAATASTQDQVAFVMTLLLPIAIYVIDVVLLSAALEYAIRGSATGSAASIVPFTYPACILALEMWLAGERYKAVLGHLQGEGGLGAVIAWTTAGIACAFAAEALVIPWVYSREMEDFDPWISIPMIVGLTGLPLIAHLAVALSGQRAVESKAWFGYVLRRRSLASDLRRDEAIRTTATREAAERFTRYTQDLERFNRSATSDRLTPGPFHRDTQALLRNYFEPADPAAAGNAAPQEAAVPPPPPAGSDNATPRPGPEQGAPQDPWAELFARQVRDADSEVRA